MTTAQTNSSQGKAVTVKTMFSRETSIRTVIQADPAIVWALLTNASDFARWNSTIVSIQGDIRQGGSIQLKSTLDEKRIFNLKIKEFEPQKRLVWGDSMGNRVYTLEKAGGNTTQFSMSEKIGGPLFPLFAGFIPAFDASFEQFAADLKREAEAIQNTQR